ncbi:P1 family peptidase [Acuticoccus sp. MNP-M23]|uniref:P1 family peptidase n=1 Tax=Acuticoccus sp. MNP-M23 TaxID=3072793 RepID=UPI002816926C|nr:P1 family peptidase [Acuticoccus sp. MNP-M23]WMS41763.1 P1 family peptidase [Acuticoccus sp. MNP-M23]
MANHIAAVPGLSVGNAADEVRRTGTTAVVFDQPATASVAVRGGAPGTRETDLLQPGNLNPGVDAIVLSGGSAFGLAAADGAQRALAEAGRGFQVRTFRIPIVPAAIIFDLSEGLADYAALGGAAVRAALEGSDRGVGTLGAGTNANTAGLKGGLGSASETVGGATVGAIVAVNAVGSVTAANGPWFRAAPFEQQGEFGGLHAPAEADFASVVTKHTASARENTVIAIVATDAALSVAEAHRLAGVAHDGIALAAYPAHTLLDGDTVFAASTGRAPAPASPADFIALHAAATRALARAMARGVYEASAVPGDRFPTWRERYG